MPQPQNYADLWKEAKTENRKMKRLIAELTVPIRNETVTPEMLKAWREKAAPFLGAKMAIH